MMKHEVTIPMVIKLDEGASVEELFRIVLAMKLAALKHGAREVDVPTTMLDVALRARLAGERAA